MSKATPGRPYTIVKGDTLSGIARQAYGQAKKWRLIWRANQTVLRSGNPDLIFPGEVINIPGTQSAAPASADLSGKEHDEFTLVVDNLEIPVVSAKVTRTMDALADGWTATVAFDTDNYDLYEALRPFGYKDASVYLGGRLVISGRLYSTSIGLSEDSVTAELEGWSYTADLIDSVSKPPYQQDSVTLKQRAEKLLEPFGIPVVYSAPDYGPFKRVTIEPQSTIFEHLASLASQRGALLSSSAKGELLIWTAQTGSSPVASIEEGGFIGTDFSCSFSGRERFASYKALSSSPKKSAKSKTANDTKVTVPRFKTFRADEADEGNLQRSADWMRSKTVARAISIDMPVDSWYSDDFNLWAENTIVTVQSKTLYMDKGFNFLIKEVSYNYDADGISASLTLVPPQVYTGEELDEPWI